MGLNKRVGRIELPSDWVKETSTDILSTLFADFYPMWIDYAGEGYLEYHGVSEHFREIEIGEEIPEYSPDIRVGEKYNFIQFNEIVEAG